MSITIRPHLMFDGKAEEAVNFYVGLFPDSSVIALQRYESGEHSGKVQVATFSVCGQEIMCIDSPIKHDFTFTPAISLLVEFEDSADQERVYAALVAGGEALMPIDDYGFSRQFAWVNDVYGVSWQLNLQ